MFPRQSARLRKLAVGRITRRVKRDLGQREAKAYLVGGDLLVLIATHPQSPTAMDRARLKSYLKSVQVGGGILANFGKTTLTLQAVLTN